MSASSFTERSRRFRLAAASLSLLSIATPLLADEIDLAMTNAGIEIESSASIVLSESVQALATGDLNDDGDLDLVIGAAGSDGAYVLFGPLSSIPSPYDLATDADIDLAGLSSSAFGHAVEIGDLNNDGDPDLVVGAPTADGPSSRTDSGAVYVFFGPLSAGSLSVALGDADVTIFGDDAGDALGATLTIANLTGTAALDLGMGAPKADGYLNAYSEAGEVNFVNGPLSAGTRDLDSTPADEIIWGPGTGTHLFMAKVGEVSGDANVDIVVGLFGDGIVGRATLRAIFGPISTGADFDLSVSPGNWRIRGYYSFPGDILIADFDGDGQKDVVATAPIAGSSLDIGVVFGFVGPVANGTFDTNFNQAQLQITYPDFTPNKGEATSLAFGDVSDDGTPDLIVGAIGGAGPDNDRLHAGRTDVFFGPVEAKTYDMSTNVAERVVYGDVGMKLGWDVAAGDFDNDGQGDLIMLAGTESTGVGSTGKVHLLAGDSCYYDAFDDASLDGGWNLIELGSANQSVASEAGGTLDITGDGTGIVAVSDDAVFLYRDDMSGDFRVEATIVGLPVNAGGTYRRGGLWVRSSATPPFGYTADEAPYVSVSYQPTGTLIGGAQLQFTMRQDWGEGGPSGSPSPNVPIASPVEQVSGAFMLPVRVAIERIGSMFCVYYFDNADGHPEWKKPLGGEGGCTDAGSEGHPVINSQPNIGLMVAADHASTTATYRFDDYAICQP